jgi:hypothetical protein
MEALLDKVPVWSNIPLFYAVTLQISSSIGRGTTIVLEALFGDLSPLGLRRPNTSDAEHVRHIVPRTLLPCSVIHNPSTNMVRYGCKELSSL